MKIANTFKLVCFVALILSFVVHKANAQSLKENALPEMVLKQTLTGLNGMTHLVEFSPDSNTILAGGGNNTKIEGAAKLWDVKTGRLMRTLKWSSGAFHYAIFSPNGKLIGVKTGENGGSLSAPDQISILDAQTGNLIRVFTEPATLIAFSPDSKSVISQNSFGKLEFLDIQTAKKKIMTLDGARRSYAIDIAQDGKTIAMVFCNKAVTTIKIWDLYSKKLKQTIFTETGESCEAFGSPFSTSVAFSTDSKSLVSGKDNDLVAEVWDVQTGKLMHTLQGAKPPFAFSVDGRTLASGGLKKGIILLWDMKNGTVRQELIGHSATHFILALDFSSDGRMLASGSQDRSVKIWEYRGNYISAVTITGYVDVVEKSGSGCRIRIISGEKIYLGTVTFSQLSALTKQRINNYEDAVRILSGKQVKVTLSNATSSTDGVSGIGFENITQMTFPVSRETNQSTQTWNERSTDTEVIIDLSTDILFDFDKSNIKPDAVPTLIRLARLIRQSKSETIQLNGFTDSIGTDEYNLELSERRAASVKQWLVSKGGVDAKRLQTKGFGESQSVAPNTNQDGSDNPVGRQKNRRVEVRIPRN